MRLQTCPHVNGRGSVVRVTSCSYIFDLCLVDRGLELEHDDVDHGHDVVGYVDVREQL